ncbi:hypothetical protein LX81_02023 [Palleronia aestuarii]|uniref:DUF6473 domain-containing protein n=1 Tax=Palleronia aestuarii TaxID=568105 RepID=A0A2W7N8Y4_9RHOB|nr:DUF6473 family protein [Palleronia aestuarii]PZX16651.1 hypothetical protein LX81_02023 [Palleronia aestuarii]
MNMEQTGSFMPGVAKSGAPGNDDGNYIAVLGGIETCGWYVDAPYPALLEAASGTRCLNLAKPHAGPDAFLGDEAVLAACQNARLTVIAVSGAHVVQNRFYAMHSRRNDRIVRQTDFLRAVYPEVDFSRHHFVRHMLGELYDRSPARFALIRDELQRNWIQRMNLLCARTGGEVVLVWVGDRSPDDPAETVEDGDPPLVTRAMLRALRGRIRATVEVLDISGSEAEALEGKIYGEGQEHAALRVPGPRAHRELGDRLAAAVKPILAELAPSVSRPVARRA